MPVDESILGFSNRCYVRLEELRSAPDDVRSYLAKAVGQMLEIADFIDSLPGYLLPDEASQRRITDRNWFVARRD